LAVTIKKILKPKRKAGSRAGLTKAVIAAAAAKRLEAGPTRIQLARLGESPGRGADERPRAL
jgi:hypothetical protein